MSSQRRGTHVPSVRLETERSLGIMQRRAAINFAWTGDIRKRYTDFLVNEVNRDGVVLHLFSFEEQESHTQATAVNRNVTAPLPPPPPPNKPEDKPSTDVGNPENPPKVTAISEDDRKTLVGLVSETVAEQLIALDEKIQAKKQLDQNERTVTLNSVADRNERAHIHQEIRRIFHSRFETTADSNGVITASPAQKKSNSRGSSNRALSQNWISRRENNQRKGKARDAAPGSGPYLHLTLYKENKDTMDAINTIARFLKIKASNFGFAGTKDRRAATVQRISVFGQKPSNLIWMNSYIPGVRVGHFAFAQTSIELGDHGGNEFVITIKNCEPLIGEDCSLPQRMKMIQQSVKCGLAFLKNNGYINYFGLQRFGTYSIGTHLLGMKILKGDLEGFLDAVLHVDESLLEDVLNTNPSSLLNKDNQANRDDLNRARAITTWKTTKSAEKALELLPKRFSTEASIIRHLGKNPKDLLGAILSITRGMRMMYIHAYQSYVWNFVATRRWARFGAKVIEGDLVFVKDAVSSGPVDDENPFAYNDDDYKQARPLTAEDIASGKYTINDVVLPLPGFDVVYPANEIGDYYAEFMGRPENGSLDPRNMRRKTRDFSLSGAYRPLIGHFIGEPEFAVVSYHDDTQQLWPTDLDYAIQHKKDQAANNADTAKAPTASTAEPKAEDGPANRWNSFAQNAAQHDAALEAERRRKADEEPKIDVTVTNETWVQTGLDGSSKRIKVARHTQAIGTSHPDGPVGDVSGGAPITGASALSGTASFADLVHAHASKAAAGAVADVPAPTVPTVPAPSSTFDLKKYLEEHASAAERQASAAASQTEAQIMAHASDALKWYMNKTLEATSGAPKEQVAAPEPMNVEPAKPAETKPAETKPANSGPFEAGRVINGIKVPQLRSACENPLAMDGDIDEGSIAPGDDKIAVVLKFRLKVSNYATVVLRELMGTTAEELAH
ncbi:hypothetical protein VTJ83DRAFT_1196 [Remersonia thermophila]|uniref:TRUD domain-containing protein n=1 Tax=Remersonia thermophila TaxID=72144 RepID=A0ABR4DNF2_9PEZI